MSLLHFPQTPESLLLDDRRQLFQMLVALERIGRKSREDFVDWCCTRPGVWPPVRRQKLPAGAPYTAGHALYDVQMITTRHFGAPLAECLEKLERILHTCRIKDELSPTSS